MRPDDANVVGNVHGGIILKMIEEAGSIVCTRHCNTQNGVSQGVPYTQIIANYVYECCIYVLTTTVLLLLVFQEVLATLPD